MFSTAAVISPRRVSIDNRGGGGVAVDMEACGATLVGRGGTGGGTVPTLVLIEAVVTVLARFR
jgi:hypothetical protein